MQNNKKKIPVHIITGFLGAGKTTFLNHFIRQRLPEKIVVIENEVGDTNIDSALVVDGSDSVLEFTAGCICCSLNEELFDHLGMLANRDEPFDRLIIETTGIADPDSVAEIFLKYPQVEKVYELKNVICLADTRHLEASLKDTEEARRQITVADVILLNKTDLLEKSGNAFLYMDILRGINPLAKIYTGSQGIFPIEEIMAISAIKEEGAETQTRLVTHQHNHLHHDITSFCLTFDQEFNMRELSFELSRLLSLYRHQIYRVKGIVAIEDRPTKVIIQSVRDSLALHDGVLWADNEVRQSKIVFIGKGVSRDAIIRIFKRCLIKPNMGGITTLNDLNTLNLKKRI